MLRLLLVVTAIAEGATGLAFLVVPNIPVWLLFGQPVDSPLTGIIGRFVGAVLIAVSLLCWRAAEDARSRAAAGVVLAMLVYDVIAAALFAYARFGLELAGPALWVAIVGHLVLALWCVAGLRESRIATPAIEGNRTNAKQ